MNLRRAIENHRKLSRLFAHAVYLRPKTNTYQKQKHLKIHRRWTIGILKDHLNKGVMAHSIALTSSEEALNVKFDYEKSLRNPKFHIFYLFCYKRINFG